MSTFSWNSTYRFLTQGKRWWISRLVFALSFPTMAETVYFGGITATRCTWSTWIGGAGHQGRQHRPTRDTQDVGGHRGELDPGILQDRVEPVGLPGPVLEEGLPGPA